MSRAHSRHVDANRKRERNTHVSIEPAGVRAGTSWRASVVMYHAPGIAVRCRFGGLSGPQVNAKPLCRRALK